MLSKTIASKINLKEFLKEYEELANRCNFDLLVPFIDREAIYWFSNGTYKGIEEIRKAFEETWSLIREEKYTITNVQWLILTDTEAVCMYSFHSDGIVDGKKQQYTGRGTNVFKKKKGKWKIVHEHLSKIS